jgi:dihydrofolate reductase
VARCVYYLAISLDGYLAEADGTLDWLTKYKPPEELDPPPGMPKSYDDFMAGVGAIAMGGRTYRQVFHEWGEPWPYGDIPSWVFTTRDEEPLEGATIEFTDLPVTEVYPAIAEAAGERDVWMMGGRGLADQFVAAGLLDEMIITVVPVVLGDGIPFVGHRIDQPMLLLGSEAQPSGMVELRYRLARSTK